MPNTLVNTYIYENLKRLHAFNATTWLCIYEPMGKLFIIKSADISCRASYEALMTLDNPHLAKIYHIAEKSDRLEVVCEYVSGDTLADLISGDRHFSQDAAIKTVTDICDGLSDIHKLGYVHRDITPNNIIITSDGCAKIIDYGIARCFSSDKSSDTVILGTPGYAAPEQFGFYQSDPRTDIYAVGVLLNVMLTGSLPNEKKVAGELGKIIGKCTEIDSHRRYKSISDLRRAVSGRAQGDSPLDRVIRQIPGIRSRHPLVVAAAVIGYVCAAIITVAFFATVKNGAYAATAVSWLLCFIVPFFCFHNFLGIWDKLPFSRGAAPRNQRIVYITLGSLSVFFGLILFGLVNSK